MQAKQQSQPEARALQEHSRVPDMLDLSTLEACCRREIENNCLADQTNAPFSIALLRRATTQDDQQAWEAWQRCVASVLRRWLHHHHRTEQACPCGDEELYLSRTFVRFRQAATTGQLHASTSLPTVLRCLQACLNGVLLDALRSKARPQGISLQEFAGPAAHPGGDLAGAHQLWERMQGLFPDAREQRVAYLLFHCHLSPEEMCCFAPQEFRDVQEIRHLRHEMFQRIVRHADSLC
jgi:hypothetical protein